MTSLIRTKLLQTVLFIFPHTFKSHPTTWKVMYNLLNVNVKSYCEAWRLEFGSLWARVCMWLADLLWFSIYDMLVRAHPNKSNEDTLGQQKAAVCSPVRWNEGIEAGGSELKPSEQKLWISACLQLLPVLPAACNTHTHTHTHTHTTHTHTHIHIHTHIPERLD